MQLDYVTVTERRFFTGLTHLRSNWPVCDPQYKMSLACSKSYVCIFMHLFFLGLSL